MATNITTTPAGRTERLTHIVIDGTARALSTPLAANWTRDQLVAAINGLSLTGVSAANGTGANDVAATGFTALAVQTERDVWEQDFSSHSGARANPTAFGFTLAPDHVFRPHTEVGGYTLPGDMGVGNGAAFNFNVTNWGMPQPLTAAKASGGTNGIADAAQNYATTPNASGVNGGAWLMVDHHGIAKHAFSTPNVSVPGGSDVFVQVRWKQNASGVHWKKLPAPDGDSSTTYPNRDQPMYVVPQTTAKLRISGAYVAAAEKDTSAPANTGTWIDAATNVVPVGTGTNNVQMEIHNGGNPGAPSRATAAGTAGDADWNAGNDQLYGAFQMVRIDRSHPTWQALVPSANQSVFSAPLTQTAYGSRKLVVNFDVKDQNGNAIDKPGLTFTVDSGTVTTTSYTAATGRYVLEYTPAATGTTLHNLNIQAKDGATTFDSDGTLIKINPTQITAVWNIAPATTNVGTTPQNVTATVTDQYGVKQKGTAQKIGIKSGGVGSVGATQYTAATGVFTVPYTPSAAGTAIFELQTLAGTDSGYADSPTKTVTVQLVPTSVTYTGGSPMVVNGASTVVQAVVRDQNGNPIDDGGNSTFTVTGGTGSTVTRAYAGNGVYNLTLTPGTAPDSLAINKTNAPTGSAAPIAVTVAAPTVTRKLIDIRPAFAVIPEGWVCVRADITYQVYKLSDFLPMSSTTNTLDENRSLKTGATAVTLYPDATTTNGPMTTIQSNDHGEPARGPWFAPINEDYVILARIGTNNVVATQYVTTK